MSGCAVEACDKLPLADSIFYTGMCMLTGMHAYAVFVAGRSNAAELHGEVRL